MMKVSDRTRARYVERTGLQPEQAAGLLYVTRARSTGALVGVYDALAAGIEDSGYVTLCEDHGLLVVHDTAALARSFASSPESFCGHCALPAEVRTSADFLSADADGRDALARLAEDGFRPIPAEELTPGMKVATRQEWFAMPAGPVRCYTVLAVTRTEWSGILVELDGTAPGEVDELAEVWARSAVAR
jgi:hypothetical protein